MRIIFATCIMLFSNIVALAKETHIAIIHSYTKGTWTEQGTAGVRAAISDAGIQAKFTEIIHDYLKIRSLPRDKIDNAVMKSAKLIKATNADLIVMFDDEAAEALMPYLSNSKTPVVLTGINKREKELKWYLKDGDSKRNFSGVWERYPFSQYLKLLKRVYPQISKICILSSENDTSHIVTAQLQDFFLSGGGKPYNVELEKTVMSSKWSTWKETISNYTGTDRAFWVVNPWNVILESTKEEVPLPTIGEYFRKNSNLASLGIVSIVHEMGFLAAFAVNAEDLGYQAGIMAAKILKEGVQPRDLPFQDNDDIRLVINKVRADELGIKIPMDLLEFATIAKKIRTDFKR